MQFLLSGSLTVLADFNFVFGFTHNKIFIFD